jgi:hypothetical protein
MEDSDLGMKTEENKDKFCYSLFFLLPPYVPLLGLHP